MNYSLGKNITIFSTSTYNSIGECCNWLNFAGIHWAQYLHRPKPDHLKAMPKSSFHSRAYSLPSSCLTPWIQLYWASGRAIARLGATTKGTRVPQSSVGEQPVCKYDKWGGGTGAGGLVKFSKFCAEHGGSSFCGCCSWFPISICYRLHLQSKAHLKGLSSEI
jgi:hypothetical protein